MDEPDDFKHPKCYANTRGGCSTKISGEHYVSYGLIKISGNNDPAYKSNTAPARVSVTRCDRRTLTRQPRSRATAIAGIVSPMLATADPSARLKLVCSGRVSRCALRPASPAAPRASQSRRPPRTVAPRRRCHRDYITVRQRQAVSDYFPAVIRLGLANTITRVSECPVCLTAIITAGRATKRSTR